MNGLSKEESCIQDRCLPPIDSGFLNSRDTTYANFSVQRVRASSLPSTDEEFPCGSINRKVDPESLGKDHIKLVPYMENFIDYEYWNEETTEREQNPNARTSAYTEWPYRHVEKAPETDHINCSYNYHTCGNLYSE
jgi:hypothetical protein